jgi:hypothetical protein
MDGVQVQTIRKQAKRSIVYIGTTKKEPWRSFSTALGIYTCNVKRQTLSRLDKITLTVFVVHYVGSY